MVHKLQFRDPALSHLRGVQVQYSCAQQKGFGQCNAAFMQPQLGRASYCATTCGRCT